MKINISPEITIECADLLGIDEKVLSNFLEKNDNSIKVKTSGSTPDADEVMHTISPEELVEAEKLDIQNMRRISRLHDRKGLEFDIQLAACAIIAVLVMIVIVILYKHVTILHLSKNVVLISGLVAMAVILKFLVILSVMNHKASKRIESSFEDIKAENLKRIKLIRDSILNNK